MNDAAEFARRRIQRLGMTGCLLAARGRFAHILEGAPDAVAALRRCIRGDERHTDVTTVDVVQIGSRRFSDWSLAYAGPSAFVERIMIAALKAADTREKRAVADLLLMMEEFASDRPYALPLSH